MFTKFSDSFNYITVDESAVLDMVSSVGISKDKIKVSYVPYDSMYQTGDKMELKIMDKLPKKKHELLESILFENLLDKSEVLSVELKVLGVPRIIIKLNGFRWVDEV